MKLAWWVLLAGLAPVLGSRADFSVAARGQPPGTVIVRRQEASPSEVYAAQELQAFTARITGVTLPVQTDDTPLPPRAILIGATRHTAACLGAAPDMASLGEEGFRLKTVGGHLLILGGPVRGALYGVYDLLERHGGCRWYTSWHSVIPTRETWTLPELDETRRPAFAMREVYWTDAMVGDFAARNKINGNGMRLEARHGDRVRFGGGLFVHTFDLLCPVAEFFTTHPEYFSEIGGRRRDGQTQLCLTNPDVLRIVTERLLERIRRDPGARLFSVSQNDWHHFCECAACKAIDDREESHAGSLLAFVNQVAEAVEREFPDVWIETLAYQYTRTPPKTLRPRRNVVPRLCSIECDFSSPLARSPYPQNRSFVADLRGWSALTDKLYVWDYTTNFAHYLAPFPNVRALRENARFFRDHGVVGLFEQGAYQGRHADFAELKAWLLAKWLWDPDLPEEPLLDDFFRGYYGAAAAPVRAYFDAIHSVHPDPERHPLRIFDGAAQPELPAGFLERAAGWWREAAEAVRDSPVHARHVRLGEMPAFYARLARLHPQDEKTVWVTAHPERFAAAPERRDLSRTLLERIAEGGSIRLSESMESHEQTLRRWRDWARAEARPPVAPAVRAVVEEDALRLARPGEWGRTVADPAAGNGFAVELFNTHFEWCLTLPFHTVAFDDGQKYRLRMRARVDPAPGAVGEAFWAGVYDHRLRAAHGGIERNVPAAGTAYAWYDVAEWIPERDHDFWCGPGRFDRASGTSAIRSLFVDRIELERVD